MKITLGKVKIFGKKCSCRLTYPHGYKIKCMYIVPGKTIWKSSINHYIIAQGETSPEKITLFIYPSRFMRVYFSPDKYIYKGKKNLMWFYSTAVF